MNSAFIVGVYIELEVAGILLGYMFLGQQLRIQHQL
jgi:hypothetical protein